jgi:hypothetical protein
MLFLPLALGPDGDEIEEDKKSYQEENLEHLPTLGRGSGILGVSVGYEKTHAIYPVEIGG